MLSSTRLIILSIAATLLLPLFSCRNPKSSDPETERLLTELDSAVSDHPLLVKQRREELKDRSQLNMAANDRERYEAYGKLRKDYNTFDLDSAIKFANRQIEIAERMNDPELLAHAKIVAARLYLTRGQIREEAQLMIEVAPDTARYNYIMDRYLRLNAIVDESNGRNALPWYRRIREREDSGSIKWIYNELNLLKSAGLPARADSLIELNRKFMLYDGNEAIYYFLRGEMQAAMGDTLNAIRNLTRSSIYDLRRPVRDYKSLYHLADLLLETGHTDRAYRYINLAIEDAEASKVLENRITINSMLSEILAAHEQTVEINTTRFNNMIIGMSLLLVVFFFAFFMALYQNHKANRISRKEKILNARLQTTNEEQKRLNRQLEESNKVRDAYLVQYLDICSEFVSEIEQIKTGMSTAFRTKGVSGVEKYLAKIDDRKEIKRFHTDFDNTFLGLFPGFVEKVNKLLRPEARLQLNRDGSMTTELRVLALIRLGIDNSDAIAQFLRKSVSTIYNCRVKIRNGAIDNKAVFVQKLHKIH